MASCSPSAGACGNRRSELRTSTLVDAWRRLARVTSRPSGDFQQALADIQLVGSPRQIELAASAMRSLNALAGDAPSVQELLETLRVELRAEMGLSGAQTPLAFPPMGINGLRAYDGGLATPRRLAHNPRRTVGPARLTARGSTRSMPSAQGQR